MVACHIASLGGTPMAARCPAQVLPQPPESGAGLNIE